VIDMDTELLKGTLSLLILSLLSRKAMYGYEIAATVHRDTDGAFQWREGVAFIRACTSWSRGGLIVGRVGGEGDRSQAALLPHHQGWASRPQGKSCNRGASCAAP